jgi:hypothetical protein
VGDPEFKHQHYIKKKKKKDTEERREEGRTPTERGGSREQSQAQNISKHLKFQTQIPTPELMYILPSFYYVI